MPDMADDQYFFLFICIKVDAASGGRKSYVVAKKTAASIRAYKRMFTFILL